MIGTPFIGLGPYQWIALITAALTLFLLADAFAGHYRSGFSFRAQYAPFISGGLLITTAISAFIKPEAEWNHLALRLAGWLAIVFGLIGFAFHHYYGIAEKPGGYKWVLHYLMYGAPQLAPLALSLTGMLALVAADGLANGVIFVGVRLRSILFVLVAIALAGATLQATILHYRGAFNNPLMFAPLSAPALAIIASIGVIVVPNEVTFSVLAILLWLTLLIGFVGLGMHLRGFGRQMGGLYVTIFNWLEGPPAFAPAFFTGVAAIGLIAIYLL